MRERIVLVVAMSVLLGTALAGCGGPKYNPNTPSAPIPEGEAARVEQEAKQSDTVSDPGGGGDAGGGMPPR